MTEPYVHASGDGPPAVLVHGTFVGGPRSFAAQAPLAEDHRLLIVDRRGYGANPARSAPGRMDQRLVVDAPTPTRRPRISYQWRASPRPAAAGSPGGGA